MIKGARVKFPVFWFFTLFAGKLAEGIHWFPDPNFFGKNPSAIATHMLATLPVVLTAFVSVYISDFGTNALLKNPICVKIPKTKT